jgi:hypothetical protein
MMPSAAASTEETNDQTRSAPMEFEVAHGKAQLQSALRAFIP